MIEAPFVALSVQLIFAYMLSMVIVGAAIWLGDDAGVIETTLEN